MNRIQKFNLCFVYAYSCSLHYILIFSAKCFFLGEVLLSYKFKRVKFGLTNTSTYHDISALGFPIWQNHNLTLILFFNLNWLYILIEFPNKTRADGHISNNSSKYEPQKKINKRGGKWRLGLLGSWKAEALDSCQFPDLCFIKSQNVKFQFDECRCSRQSEIIFFSLFYFNVFFFRVFISFAISKFCPPKDKA